MFCSLCRKAKVLRLLLPGMVLLLCSVSEVMGQIRVGNWNIAQLRGDFSAIEAVLEEASLDDSHGFAVPVGIWIFQEVDTDNIEDLHSLLGSRILPRHLYLEQ